MITYAVAAYDTRFAVLKISTTYTIIAICTSSTEADAIVSALSV